MPGDDAPFMANGRGVRETLDRDCLDPERLVWAAKLPRRAISTAAARSDQNSNSWTW